MLKIKNKINKRPDRMSPTCQVNDHDFSWRITMSLAKRSLIVLLTLTLIVSYVYGEANLVPTGMTDEHDAGFYLKRARILETQYGSGAFHRDRFARLNDY